MLLVSPKLPGPSRSPLLRLNELGRQRRNGRVVCIEAHLGTTDFLAAGALQDDNIRVAGMQKPDYRDEMRLGLDRDNACTQPAKTRCPIAHMGADIEDKI